ncbi:MAG: ester cyclase [Pirellulaceae bacterium]|nr:ester cyclase [Pirellulaceae bacterium]
MSVINQRNKAVVWDFWQRMNFAEPDQVAGLVEKTFHKDVDWNASQPINQIRGTDALVADFYEPLRGSFPDLKLEADILMGGVRESSSRGGNGAEWVSGTGHLIGTFVHDWIGIPATGKKTVIHFGQYLLMRDGKVAASYTIFDTLGVMKQAGFQVLPPALGQEGGKVIKPYENAILLAEQDEQIGRQTRQAVSAMGSGMGRYIRSRDGLNLESMGQQMYWDQNFHWMGPTGIGSSHNLEEYEDYHQRPWLVFSGDRQDTMDFEPKGGLGVGGYAEGKFSCGGIWDWQWSRHHGEYQGVEATGKILTMRDFDWYYVDGGKIVQNWVPIDMVDIFLQLDVDLFDRMHRQHELRKRGIDWWNLPLDGFGEAAAQQVSDIMGAKRRS